MHKIRLLLDGTGYEPLIQTLIEECGLEVYVNPRDEILFSPQYFYQKFCNSIESARILIKFTNSSEADLDEVDRYMQLLH